MHAVRKIGIGTAGAFVAFLGFGFSAEGAQHHPGHAAASQQQQSIGLVRKAKTCTPHTAYVVYGHYLPTHTVKATAKHSAYQILGHYVPAHTVAAKSC